MRMECNNIRTEEHQHERKRARKEDSSTPPHQKDPTPSSHNGNSGTPTTKEKLPNTESSIDGDQIMDDQVMSNMQKSSWGDDNDTGREPPLTQADLLDTLHVTLESAMATLNRLSIHVVYPERTLALMREILRRSNKIHPQGSQGPSDNILSAIQRLAKDVEDLKRTAPNPLPPPPDLAKPKNVFATGPTIRPKPKNPKPTQPTAQPNNPWQQHHPARLILQIPSPIDLADRLDGMKAVEATNVALAPLTKGTIIAVKWNDKGNCIVISHPDYNATDLEPFGNTIATALTGIPNIECITTPDRKWHRVILNGVDTGKSDIDEDIELSHFQGHH